MANANGITEVRALMLNAQHAQLPKQNWKKAVQVVNVTVFKLFSIFNHILNVECLLTLLKAILMIKVCTLIFFPQNSPQKLRLVLFYKRKNNIREA